MGGPILESAVHCVINQLKVSVLSLKPSNDGCDAQKQESRGSQDGEGSVQIQIQIEVHEKQETKIGAKKTEIGGKSIRSGTPPADNKAESGSGQSKETPEAEPEDGRLQVSQLLDEF